MCSLDLLWLGFDLEVDWLTDGLSFRILVMPNVTLLTSRLCVTVHVHVFAFVLGLIDSGSG